MTTGPDMTGWSSTMQVIVRTSIHAKIAISTFWGESMLQVYNEAFGNLMGLQLPFALVSEPQLVWGVKWPELAPLLHAVLKEGRSLLVESFPLRVNRKGVEEERYFTLSCSPVYNDEALVEGVFLLATENPLLVNGAKAIVSEMDVPAANNQNAESSNRENTTQKIQGANMVLNEQREELLNNTEAVYNELAEEVQDYGFVLLDSNGIIRSWNKGAEKIKQYTESEIVGQHFSVFHLPADRKINLPDSLLERARVNGMAIHEGWRLRKDQTRFWGKIAITAMHDSANNITGFSKVTHDMSDQKVGDEQVRAFMNELQQVNESLRKSEERYQQMIAEVQDYAIILLDENANIINWNAGAAAIKGYKAEEVIGRNIRIFYTETDKQNFLPEKLFKEAVEKGKALQEGWRLRKDGTAFWGSISITALHNKAGGIIGFSKVTRDLTQKKYAEDKMREYLLELESKNRELEQFAYLASHDLQEPLRKIQIFIEILQRGLHDEKAVRTYLAKIVHSAKRMSELIQSVLQYCGLTTSANTMVTTDFNLILQHVMSDLELLILDSKAEIDSHTLPVIPANPMFVTQLFTNLISNAIKFTTSEPRIMISSRQVDREQIPGIPANVAAEHYFEISIADNGIGFEEKYQTQIFSIFQRLHGKNEFPGVGIGLALCKKIMELHSGFITAKSELSKGSVFYVYFPAG